MTEDTTFRATTDTLKERAVAAYQSEVEQRQAREAALAAKDRADAIARLERARAPIAAMFGIDLDWTPHISGPGLLVDGLYLWPVEEGYNQWALGVQRSCPRCGDLDAAYPVRTLFGLGSYYAGEFQPAYRHQCRPSPADDADDLPFDDAPAAPEPDRSAADRFVDALLDVLAERGVVLDGGTV